MLDGREMQPLVLVLLMLSLTTTWAAETDWCPVEAAQYGNDTKLALKGKRIRCGALEYPPYSIYDEGTRAWGGYDMELMTEVAKRGEFKFEVVMLPTPAEGENYDSILYGPGRQLDMMCTWWANTAPRKSRSITFTSPTVETSAILAAEIPRPTRPPFTEQFWTFLAPFSRDLWLVLLFGVLFSAVFLYIVDPKLEPATADAGGRETMYGQSDWNIIKALFNGINTMFYQGWMLFTVQELYRSPGNWMSKIYLMSWTGVCVVLVAAYTAQLTTFLIIELQRVSSINNLDDLMRSNLGACALVSVPAVKNFLNDQAPGLYVIPITSITEAFPAVRAGKCGAALLGYSDAQINIANNKQCDMRIVGSPLNFRWMAGAFAADTSNCGSFVLRTVDVLLQSIREEGVMDDIWDKYTRKPPECISQSKPNKDDSDDQALSLQSVGGLFIMHAAICFIALAGFIVQRVRAWHTARGLERQVSPDFPSTRKELDPRDSAGSFAVMGRPKSAVSSFHKRLFSADVENGLENGPSSRFTFEEGGSGHLTAEKEVKSGPRSSGQLAISGMRSSGQLVDFGMRGSGQLVVPGARSSQQFATPGGRSSSEMPVVNRQRSVISSFHNKMFRTPPDAE